MVTYECKSNFDDFEDVYCGKPKASVDLGSAIIDYATGLWALTPHVIAVVVGDTLNTI